MMADRVLVLQNGHVKEYGETKRSGKSAGFVYKEADGICAETEKVRDRRYARIVIKFVF